MNYKVQKFVRSWDFTRPKWDSLPKGFPECDIKGLTTKQDRHLFEAIKSEWIIEGGGRSYFVKTLVRGTLVGSTIIVLVLLGKAYFTNPNINITRSASAKTVSTAVGNIVEATMSAVFKK